MFGQSLLETFDMEDLLDANLLYVSDKDFFAANFFDTGQRAILRESGKCRQGATIA